MKFLFFSLLFFSFSAAAQKPNILILSLDSLRRETKFEKNFDPNVMPNLNNLTENGILFKNIFTAQAWDNLGLWIAKIPQPVFEKSGYTYPGLGWTMLTMSKFGFNNNKNFPPRFFILMPAESEGYEKGMNYLKNKLISENTKPFFLMMHFKDLHPPLFKEVPEKPVFRKLVENYIREPENHADKAVLFSVLFDEEPRLKHSSPVLKSIIELVRQKKIPKEILKLKYVNLTDMPIFIDLWKKSHGYETDLLLIKELYQLNQKNLDLKIKSIISYLEEKKLSENTITIVTSNFGFGIMEHNQLFNAVGNYNEFIGTHLFIHTPNTKGLKIMYEQSSLKSLGTFIYTLLDKGYKKENLNLISESEIFTSNFNRDNFSVSQNNEWKFHLNFINSQRELYKISEDSEEKKNVLLLYPEKTAELESAILNKLIMNR
jgi:hypothetical protein